MTESTEKSYLQLKLDLSIILAHISPVLEADKLRLDVEIEKNKSSISTSLDVCLMSLAFNQFQRAYEQSQTFFHLLEESHKDLSSMMSIVRSLYETLLDYNYIFSCPIFKSDIGKKPSNKQLLLKYIIHEYYGLAFLIKNYKKKFTDIGDILGEEQSPKILIQNLKDKKSFLKDFDDTLLINETDLTDVIEKNKVRENFKSFKKKLNRIKYLASNTHKHLLLNKSEIAKIKGYDDIFATEYYSYLSDHCHIGKGSLLEYSSRKYDLFESKTIDYLQYMCLFILCQFYLEYVNFRKLKWGKDFGMNEFFYHKATDTKISSKEIIEYWLNFFRREDCIRSHFVPQE